MNGMNNDGKRMKAADNPPKRKADKKRAGARKRKARLMFIFLGLILILVLSGLIVHMVKGRHPDRGADSDPGTAAGIVESDTESDAETTAETGSGADIVIGLKGSSVQMVLKGEPYIENGAFAIDKNSGAIPESDIRISGTVDTSQEGDYEIEYTAGIGASEKTAYRTVRVLTGEEYGRAAGNVPVMMYHWVYTAEDVPEELDGNWILDTTLDEQLTYLEDEGYYFPGWKELRAWVDDEISLPAKCAVLTFDDGKEQFLKYGIPLLEKHRIPATSFMICWEKNDGEEKIKEYASPYIDFESHTYAMHQKSDDPQHKGIDAIMSREEISEDLEKAAGILGNNDAIAYPYGDYTDDFTEAVREQGILCGFTVEYDRVRKGMDPLLLPRVRVLGDESFQIWKESVW